MKTINNVMEFYKDLFKVEELYERAGIIVEEFDGVEPDLVSDEDIESYILELRKYLAESELSPSQIFLRPDGKIELLFYPINARGFTEDELNTLAYELDIAFTFYNRLKVEIPENIISDYKPELTQSEMYYLFIAGLSENTKDFKNNILGEIPTPINENAIEITIAQ
jgi:hypothetical protein